MRALLALLILLAPAAARAQQFFGTNAPAGSASVITPTGTVGAASLGDIAAQQGVLLDAFRVAGDADDTASMTRAVAAGVPILLGPKTYTINNYVMAGTPSAFVLRGTPGKSLIQRTSASGSQFFQITAATVVLDGVTFDMNKASVTANQWGVFLGAGGQTISVRNSVLKNNSGTLGSCLGIASTGPAAGGSFGISNSEFTGCTFDTLYLASVSNGVVSGNYIHDNSSFGIWLGANGAASASNYSTNVLVTGNTVNRNTTGIQVGGYSPPYTFGTPQATYITVTGNILQDNSTYGASIEADYAVFSGNTINKSAPGVTVFGGFDALSRWLTVADNTITLPNTTWGIDCGGSIEVQVLRNLITMNQGIALNTGGNQNSVYSDNKLILTGTSTGVSNYAVEADGSSNTFPTLSSGTIIERNTFDMNGASVNGVVLHDNAGGLTGTTAIVVRGNHFAAGTGTPSTAQAITWFGGPTSLAVTGNDWNGVNTTFVDPNGNGDVIVSPVYLGGTVLGVSSSVNIRAVITPAINTFGAGGSILYAYPTSGGSGYTAATTLTANGTGGGSGWTGVAQIYGGAIIGVRTLTNGTAYSGTLTITAADSGGGTGAVIAVGNKVTLPAYSTITYSSVQSHLLQKSGGNVAINYPGGLMLDSTTAVGLQAIAGGLFWNVIGYTIPTIAFGSLPTCAAAYNSVEVHVSGSVSGKWQARCNGSNWIAPDGTTIN